jgi:pimeloyl-ACP methyl ester carboxylesterase
MRVAVDDGVRLFFDVDGAQWVPDGPRLKERPIILLLHGGPGFDHSSYKPGFAAALGDAAQLIYLDHRGQGRSDRDVPARWNLARWADDVRAFCDALGIGRPIVFGNSFGGMVAMAYAARHPEHPAKLILSSTATAMHWERMYAKFEQLGGPEVRAIAETFWTAPSPQTLGPYIARAMPLYQRTPRDPDVLARTSFSLDVLFHFAAGEQLTMDLRPGLAKIACPTLVLGGEDDPVTPIACQEDIVAALPPGLGRFERFAGCGHGPYRDDPARAFAVIREFVAS